MNLKMIAESIANKKATQEDKNRYYQEITASREIYTNPATEIDETGNNLLHWAVLCNQPGEEVSRILDESKIDINQGTVRAKDVSIYNVTPLWSATAHGNAALVELLIGREADISIRPRVFCDLRGVIINYSYWIKGETAFDVAKRLDHGDIIKLLEKPALEHYFLERKENRKEYKTSVKIPFFNYHVNFGHSKTDKLKATGAFKELLESKSEVSQKELATLKQAHPSVDQGELQQIYQASLGIRK